MPARVLHGRIRHQSVDEPGRTPRYRPRDAPVAAATGHLPPPRPHRAHHRSPARPARHGLRGQRRHRDRRQGPRRVLPACAAGGGRSGVLHLVYPQRLRRRRLAPPRERGRGGHRLRRARDPGRVRQPHRRRGRQRACGPVRPARAQPPAGGSPVLSPGHGPVRPGRRHRRLLPGSVRRCWPGPAGQPFRGADRGQGRGRRSAGPERGQRRPARRAARAGHQPRGPGRGKGFEPVPVDMSEFRKAGGGPKCCTLELR